MMSNNLCISNMQYTQPNLQWTHLPLGSLCITLAFSRYLIFRLLNQCLQFAPLAPLSEMSGSILIALHVH